MEQSQREKCCLLLTHSTNTLHFTEHDGSAHCWTDGSLSLSRAWWIQSTPSNYFVLISVLILSSCLHPRLQSGKISLGFPTKILCAFFFSPHVSHPLSISPLTWSLQLYLVRAGLFEIFYSHRCVLSLSTPISSSTTFTRTSSAFFFTHYIQSMYPKLCFPCRWNFLPSCLKCRCFPYVGW